jgi:hypothetical protein
MRIEFYGMWKVSCLYPHLNRPGADVEMLSRLLHREKVIFHVHIVRNLVA